MEITFHKTEDKDHFRVSINCIARGWVTQRKGETFTWTAQKDSGEMESGFVTRIEAAKWLGEWKE